MLLGGKESVFHTLNIHHPETHCHVRNIKPPSVKSVRSARLIQYSCRRDSQCFVLPCYCVVCKLFMKNTTLQNHKLLNLPASKQLLLFILKNNCYNFSFFHLYLSHVR